jgi:hypothetical protein
MPSMRIVQETNEKEHSNWLILKGTNHRKVEVKRRGLSMIPRKSLHQYQVRLQDICWKSGHVSSFP